MSNDGAPPNRIRELRLAQNLSQERLARDADVSLTTVRNLETGRMGGNIDSFRAIARALGCGMDDLFPEPEEVAAS